MDRIERISQRIVAASIRDILSELLPSEAFKVLMGFDQKTQGEVLVALQMQNKLTLKFQTSRTGDPARSGSESGWILAINDSIKTVNTFDPGGSEVVRSPHKWNEFAGNHIEMAQYERSWYPLD